MCKKNFFKKYNLLRHKKCKQHFIIDDVILPRLQPFECGWCNFQASTSLEVQTHINKNHLLAPQSTLFQNLPNFYCPFELCKTRTHSKDLMRSHFYYVHKSSQTFENYLKNFYTTCIYCKSKVKNAAYKTHFNLCKNIQTGQ